MSGNFEFERIALNWRNYRTEIKGYPAIISANLDLPPLYLTGSQYILARCSLAYVAEENGLPLEVEEAGLFNNILKLLTQATALENVLYAGYVLSQSVADIYFYVLDEKSFIDTIAEIISLDHIEIQEDPNWEVYFDFLMPSLLEDKFSLTEDRLNLLQSNGVDLSHFHHIEHRFHFTDFSQMIGFIEQCSLSQIDFINIKHTEQKIFFEDQGDAFYLLKLEQYICLDSLEIYQTIEKLLELIRDLSAEYMDWISLETVEPKSYLN